MGGMNRKIAPAKRGCSKCSVKRILSGLIEPTCLIMAKTHQPNPATPHEAILQSAPKSPGEFSNGSVTFFTDGGFPPGRTRWTMKPDVIVTFANQTALFKSRNERASEWLHHHCHLPTESVSGDTEFQVHPNRCKRIVEELKAAGFNVSNL